MKTRVDMSEWIVHFVHGRNPDNEAVLYNDDGDGAPIPWHVESERATRAGFDIWAIKDKELPLEPDAEAISVVLRILDDGHIRAGWSVRNGRATVYGPRPACCFTEMPLYALIDYSKSRGNSKAVDVYGIAVPKQEMFLAGGRPVIYGVSGRHLEAENRPWPRLLDASCGLAECEQYRYVAMNLRNDRPIDWSHEREWRWSDVRDELDCPGLPIWLQSKLKAFSTVIVVVRSAREAEIVLDRLKLMRDSGGDDYGHPYNREAIAVTRVLILDEVQCLADKLPHQLLRIDDVPLHELKEALAVTPNGDTIARVRTAVDTAREAARQAAEAWRRIGPQNDVFGSAYLMVDRPRSEVVQAMSQLNLIEPSGGIGYRVAGIGGFGETGLLGEAEAAVEAAKRALEKGLPGTTFYARTLWD